MKAPRVLQVVLQLDPGGTERLVVGLVSRLHPRIPMAVCCLDAPGAWAPRLTSIGVPVVSLHRKPGFGPGPALGILALARELDIDILHCHHYSPFVYGRLAAYLRQGCRVIYTEHGRLSDAPPSRKRRAANRLLMAGVEELIAVSHDLRAHMLREAVPQRLRVVWNGIDVGEAPDVTAREAARSRLRIDTKTFLVASVARLDPVKDLGVLIGAAADARQVVPELQVLLIGDGPERAHLERVATEAGAAAQVQFVGHREDARALLAAADVYANCSTSEGISLTILEAMAAELPVVATRVGGTPEVVVDGETGRLVPARDRASLAAALVNVGRDALAARLMGKAGRRRVVQCFTIDRMVNEYARMYGAHEDALYDGNGTSGAGRL